MGAVFSPDAGQARNLRRAALLLELSEAARSMTEEDYAEHAIDTLRPLSDQDKTVMLAGLIHAAARS